MAYELYKSKLTREEYFKQWTSKNAGKVIIEDIQNEIFRRYKLKCEVFSRDNYVCRNSTCKHGANITLHHVRFQKNGGKDTSRNILTLCETCHKSYHQGRISITTDEDAILPKTLRNKTFKLTNSERINWKRKKKEMRKFRKKLMLEIKNNISWTDVNTLMRFLYDDFE